MALLPSDGVDFLLKVNTGSEENPSWITIGGQRGATLSMTAAMIDASNKMSGAWTTSVPGLMSWSIDADAVILTDIAGMAVEAGRQCLLSSFYNRKLVHVRYVRKDGSKFQGYAAITDLSEEAPHDDVATYKIKLEGSGAPEEVNGMRQVETATVAGKVTSSGNAIFTITALGLTNSLKVISVEVTEKDSAAVVAQKAREALEADSEITKIFDINGIGSEIVLTKKLAEDNDATLNIAIANDTCKGLTIAPYSKHITPGIAPSLN